MELLPNICKLALDICNHPLLTHIVKIRIKHKLNFFVMIVKFMKQIVVFVWLPCLDFLLRSKLFVSVHS